MRTLLSILIPALTTIIIFSCAVKEGPSGGPEDTTKPTIVSVKPEPQSTNIPFDTRFHIVFSKPMNRDKTESAIFLSPVFWDYPAYNWNGKELIVTPPEKLERDKTYVLTIGADATGYHGNPMGSSYSFAFSTGDSIDSSSISGSIYLEGGRPSAYDIWVYPIEDTDTAFFLTDIPFYATQVDSMSEFEIKNVASGRYIVVAVDDRNDDLFWDPTSESIGLPPEIISLGGGDIFEGFVLKPERRDTVLAEFSRVRPIDNRKLSVEFSQPVLEKLKLDTTRYHILGSDSALLAIEGAFIGEGGGLIIETAMQEPEKSYLLKPKEMYSLWGNSFDTSGTRFTGSSIIDTTAPDLLSSKPANGSGSDFQNRYIELIFTERIKILGFPDAVTVIADSIDTLSYAPHWTYPNNVHLIFGTGIPRQKNIEVKLDRTGIYDVAGNAMGDSILSISFRIAPADTVGSVTAKTDNSGNLIGELSPLKSGRETYTIHADGKGKFLFDAVLPGIYYFSYFDDTDSNEIWSSGAVKPFLPSEWFYYYRDSINVRSRWTTDLGQVE